MATRKSAAEKAAEKEAAAKAAEVKAAQEAADAKAADAKAADAKAVDEAQKVTETEKPAPAAAAADDAAKVVVAETVAPDPEEQVPTVGPDMTRDAVTPVPQGLEPPADEDGKPLTRVGIETLTPVGLETLTPVGVAAVDPGNAAEARTTAAEDAEARASQDATVQGGIIASDPASTGGVGVNALDVQNDTERHAEPEGTESALVEGRFHAVPKVPAVGALEAPQKPTTERVVPIAGPSLGQLGADLATGHQNGTLVDAKTRKAPDADSLFEAVEGPGSAYRCTVRLLQVINPGKGWSTTNTVVLPKGAVIDGHRRDQLVALVKAQAAEVDETA